MATRRRFKLPGERRLCTSAQITRVFRQGKNRSDKLFTVMASPNDRDYARLGMAISLKATGKAVVRNRVKRLVREYFRTHQGDLPAVDVVFIARQAVCSSSSSDLSASLDWHFRQIKKHAQHSPASD